MLLAVALWIGPGPVAGAGAGRTGPHTFGWIAAPGAGARPGSAGCRVQPGRPGGLSGGGHGGVDRGGRDRGVRAAEAGAVLRRAADLLALGSDPAVAWSISPDLPADSVDAQIDSLLRLARRSASSGAALADGVAELADQSRHDAAQAATAAAERAGVLIAGPLGLCFLPAFVCLGIVPVVAGLAGDVLQSGLL